MLMSSADILEGVTLTDTESTRAADELAHIKKVLKNIIFAGAKYLMNKSRQERLRLPTRIPVEHDIQKLRNFTVGALGELSECDGFDRLSFVHLRHLICSRLTLFNASRGGDRWNNRHRVYRRPTASDPAMLRWARWVWPSQTSFAVTSVCTALL